MNGHTLAAGGIEEANFVSDVHANRVANECFAAFNLNKLINVFLLLFLIWSALVFERLKNVTYIPNDDGVVVLSSERSQVFLIVGERQGLDEDFVELKSVHHLKGVEVPDDNVSLNKLVCVGQIQIV